MIVTLVVRSQTITLTIGALNTNHGGGSGVSVHADLTGRSAVDGHPIAAITGLQTALDAKAEAGHTHTGVYDLAGTTAAHAANTANPHSVTAAQVGAATTAQGALADTAVQPARTISAAGLATGGGTLATDRTITVAASTAATVSTGTATAEAMTPGALKDSTPYYVDRAADWTLALADRNKDQWFNNGASALVCTIPLNSSVAFAVGDTIPFVRLASGTATIDAATSVTLNGVSGGSCTISTRYQGALLKKIATDSWVVSGDVSAVA